MADYHKDNASFMLYKNWRALFDSCTDEEAGRLIKALFGFACDGEVPELDRMLSGIFMMMTQQMKADGEKWERTCERRKAGGCKGGRPPKPKGSDENLKVIEETEETKRFFEKPIEPDKIREDKISKDKISKDNNISPNAEAFEKVWAQYPKREGRKDALAAFEKAIKKGTTVEQIENGIQAYCEHIKKCNIDRQFIKQGSTYFRGEHWNDVYDDSEAATAEPKKKTSYDLSKVIPAIPVN